MGVKTFTQDFESSVAPSRLFKALCVDSHNLLPKLMPDTISSIEFVQGSSAAPGSVLRVKFNAEGVTKCVKHKIEEVNAEKLYFKYTVTSEGPSLDEKIERIVVEEKMEAKGKGCATKFITHFHTKGEAELDDEKLGYGKERIVKIFKVVEEFLQANPDAYA